jgi:large repetitive protein
MRSKLASAAFVVLGLTAIDAQAQTFNLENLPATVHARDSFATARLSHFSKARLSLSALLDYTNDPFVVTVDRPQASTTSRIVSDYAALHVHAGFALTDRVLLFAGVDAPFFMEGDDDPALFTIVPPANGGGMGDARLGARGVLWRSADQRFGLGAEGAFSLPISRADENGIYRGDQYATFLPQLIGDAQLAPVRISANLGVLIRDQVRVLSVTAGTELRYSAALGVPVMDELELLAELFGSNRLADFVDRTSSKLEWLAGVKSYPSEQFTVSAGVGTGLLSGVGSPDLRLVLAIGGMLLPAEPPPPVAVDSDADGIDDTHDGCPAQAEDIDQFQDADGCPDPDNDADGLADAVDRCANEAEDKDGIEDADGCPEAKAPVLDKDGDGLLDDQDRCLDQAEDKDGFQDDDGCPEVDPDGDADGVPDHKDRCPTQPGVEAEGGCPGAVKVNAASGTIDLDKQVQFATGTANILDESTALLTELAEALKAHPEVKRVRIEGHTDSHGSRQNNARLSRARSVSVGNWLIANGVAADRLEAWGCAAEHPIQTNTTAEGRAANRRVMLFIVDPPSPTVKLASRCVAVPLQQAPASTPTAPNPPTAP